jgi:hypothetical protein
LLPLRPQVNSGRGPEWDLSYGSNYTPRRLSYGSKVEPYHPGYGSNCIALWSREQKAHDEKIIVVATARRCEIRIFEPDIAIFRCALAARRNDFCAFDHQDDRFFWGACAVNHSAWDCEALLGHQLDGAVL